MCKATGVFTFVYWSDGSFQLVLSYDGVGFHYNHLSSLMGNMRALLLEHPAVWHWGPRAMAGEGSRVSVLGGVLCTMEPSAQQCELLHYFLHSPLVHSVSARQRICTFIWDVWKKHISVRVKRCSHVALPEYLLWEVVFLLCCDPWWREPWRLQRLLQPHTKQRETVLVQAEQHFCELVHEAPRCPAPNTLLAAGWSRQIRRRKLLMMMDEVTALWKQSQSIPAPWWQARVKE